MTITAILPKFITAIGETLANHADELTALDQFIGDGDHLINLQRGVAGLADEAAGLASVSWTEAWERIGMICLNRVGGASGSLLGSLFIRMAKVLAQRELTAAVCAECFMAGVEAVKQRGKSEAGQKTLLDVLVPVAAVLDDGARAGLSRDALLTAIVKAATAGADATRDMLPTRGRALFLGERAVGTLDPGAKSCQLILCALAEVLRSSSAAPA